MLLQIEEMPFYEFILQGILRRGEINKEMELTLFVARLFPIYTAIAFLSITNWKEYWVGSIQICSSEKSRYKYKTFSGCSASCGKYSLKRYYSVYDVFQVVK